MHDWPIEWFKPWGRPLKDFKLVNLIAKEKLITGSLRIKEMKC
jgi:hypothetical protein